MAFPPIEPFVISANQHVPRSFVRALRLRFSQACCVLAGSDHKLNEDDDL